MKFKKSFSSYGNGRCIRNWGLLDMVIKQMQKFILKNGLVLHDDANFLEHELLYRCVIR